MKDTICPICDFSCFYCDGNGYCTLNNCYECDDFCYYDNYFEDEEEGEEE